MNAPVETKSKRFSLQSLLNYKYIEKSFHPPIILYIDLADVKLQLALGDREQKE